MQPNAIVLRAFWGAVILVVLSLVSAAFCQEQWRGYKSGRYKRAGVSYRVGDDLIEVDIGGRPYEFRKVGRNLYHAYDDETGSFMEMKVRSKGEQGVYNFTTPNGEGIIYDYENGEDYYVELPGIFW